MLQIAETRLYITKLKATMGTELTQMGRSACDDNGGTGMAGTLVPFHALLGHPSHVSSQLGFFEFHELGRVWLFAGETKLSLSSIPVSCLGAKPRELKVSALKARLE
ncbi:hypothetical protein HG530_015462 [Fusarium avenaceum]|nr:hypothetical protein HG530_015462 [Fusarium avenaceum]